MLTFSLGVSALAAQPNEETCKETLAVTSLLTQHIYEKWLPGPNRVEWHQGSLEHLDPQLITAAYVIVFNGQGQILMGRHRVRGRDILGGHLEKGESPAVAAEREAGEEVMVTIEAMTLVGYQSIELLGPKPEGYKYPHPQSYQVLYFAKAVALGEFHEEEDMVERAWFDLSEMADKRFVLRNPLVFQKVMELNAKLF